MTTLTAALIALAVIVAGVVALFALAAFSGHSERRHKVALLRAQAEAVHALSTTGSDYRSATDALAKSVSQP